MTVRDIDRGYRKVITNIGILGHDITVGVHGDDGATVHRQGEGMTIAEIAEAHEFGIPEGAGPTDQDPRAILPERSFVRSWADEQGGEFLKEISHQCQAVAAGKKTAPVAAKQLAVRAEGQMKKRMIRGEITPPLTKYTIEHRIAQSATPLVDTGQLVGKVEGRAEAKK